MKRVKLLRLFVYLTFMSALLSGCWNYMEVEKLAIVSGIAVDKKEDNYLFTSEFVVIKGGKDSKISTKLLTTEGVTVSDAARNAIKAAGKKPYFSHAEVVIISKQIAEEGIVTVLDMISRNIEPRNTLRVLISKEKSAKDILQQQPMTSEVLSFELSDILQSEKSLSTASDIQEWQFLNDLANPGVSAILPTVDLIASDSVITPEITGTAMFKEDKLVGFLDGEETKTMLFIKNKITGGLLAKKEFTGNITTNISLEILKNKTKLKPHYSNGKLSIEVDTDTDTAITEIAGRENYIEEPALTIVKKDFEAMLENNMKRLIKKAQEQYDSDIFGFGKAVKLNMPGLWKKVEAQWDQYYKNIDVEVHSTIHIKNSAFQSKPLKVGN